MVELIPEWLQSLEKSGVNRFIEIAGVTKDAKINMTVEQVKGLEQKYVLVGIRFDAQSRELLNWALVKVAEPGDQVVAIYVCRGSESDSKDQSFLDNYLEVYEGICNVKKVHLTAQILSGNSVRRVLVREAKKCVPSALLVGIDKQSALGIRTATAKYCAKRLPSSVDVLAVHNGKVVFRRCNSSPLPGLNGDPRPSVYLIGKTNPRASVSEFGGDSEAETEFSSIEATPKTDDKPSEDMKDQKSIVIWEQTNTCSRSISMGDCLEQKPGWPLLRKTTSDVQQSAERRRMSVVQWAISLPDRSPYILPRHTGSTEDQQEKKSVLSVFEEEMNALSEVVRQFAKEMEVLLETKASKCIWFAYQVLRNSCNQFSPDNLIGKGGSNRVFKGTLLDGSAVAIKVLKSSLEAQKDFAREIEVILSLNHKYITPLRGICIKNKNLVSVYDFLSRGSLEKNLHGAKEDKQKLTWKVRYDIAIRVAEALQYLHNECSRSVIHRDVKSSNILLSDDFVPQLSDFGLAIWGPTTSSSFTGVDLVGTFGYLAPEYFMYGKVSDKIDVYAFGIVLLELLSGRKPISSNAPKGQESLVMWAKPIIESGNVRSILDPDLDADVDKIQLRRMVLAASLCIKQAASLRPSMSQILKLLKGESDADTWTNTRNNNLDSAENPDDKDDEVYPTFSAASHLDLALLDVCEDYTSFSSTEPRVSLPLEEYMKERWSRSCSFD